MRTHWIRSVQVALFVSLWAATSAQAGGFQIETQDAASTGRGLANVAGTDDAGAVFANPAGMSFLGWTTDDEGEWIRPEKHVWVKLSYHYVFGELSYDAFAGEGPNARAEAASGHLPT
ncbi:outer membrane protein transport protein, partial [Planctomycetota bacterium]|nr:outer membrane protein transport protein [Planctomycetota bacterium]